MITTEAPPNPMKVLEQILDGAADLAALPQVVMRVMDLTNDPKATAADLEKIIALDQALAAKILTLANSSYYGLPRRVSTLREAVVFLGFKTLRNMAMTITTFNLFLGRSDTPALARRALWRHSVDTAQCARVVTGLLPPTMQEAIGIDQAYTCGLLHDVGKMALDRSRHALFVSITQIAHAHQVRFSVIEAEVLPFGHGQIGASLATRWNLPPMLCEAIAYHHTPRAAELNPKLTATICLANEMAHYLADEAAEEREGEENAEAWDQLHQSCLEAALPLRVSEESLRAITRSCRTELAKGLSTQMF
jgi:putative nucleotidyltransferase with HDIG domain